MKSPEYKFIDIIEAEQKARALRNEFIREFFTKFVARIKARKAAPEFRQATS